MIIGLATDNRPREILKNILTKNTVL